LPIEYSMTGLSHSATTSRIHLHALGFEALQVGKPFGRDHRF
jgi:hypothetical protein